MWTALTVVYTVGLIWTLCDAGPVLGFPICLDSSSPTARIPSRKFRALHSGWTFCLRLSAGPGLPGGQKIPVISHLCHRGGGWK